MNQLVKKPWFWPLSAIVVLAIFTKGAVFAALAPLYKLALPIALGYVGYRFVKNKLKRSMIGNLHRSFGEFQKYQDQAMNNTRTYQNRQGANEPPVIEICPNCGEQRKPQCPNCQ